MGMGIMTAVKGRVNVQSLAYQSCDAIAQSAFPSVRGRRNDILLLSQVFDDPAVKSDFTAPPSTELMGDISGADTAAFLYGKVLTERGPTGILITGGQGEHLPPIRNGCKDALISLLLRGGDKGQRRKHEPISMVENKRENLFK